MRAGPGLGCGLLRAAGRTRVLWGPQPDLCASALGRAPRPRLAARAGRSPSPPGRAGTARAAVASSTPSAASRSPGLPLPLPQPARLSSGPCSPFRFFCEGSQLWPFAGPRRLHLESTLFPRILTPALNGLQAPFVGQRRRQACHSSLLVVEETSQRGWGGRTGKGWNGGLRKWFDVSGSLACHLALCYPRVIPTKAVTFLPLGPPLSVPVQSVIKVWSEWPRNTISL